MNLKDYLRFTNTSEAAFAAKIGVSQAAVNRYCNGRIPKREVIEKIASASKMAVQVGDFYAIKPKKRASK